MAAKGFRGSYRVAGLAVTLGLLSGCAGLAGVIGAGATGSSNTGTTSSGSNSTGSNTSGGSTATGASAVATQLTDLQQISALSQLTALGGAGGASGLVSTSPLTSTSPYAVLSVATASMTATQLQQFNSQSGWQNGNTSWSFVATSGWFDLTGSGGTFLGTETVKDASGDILETDPMEMDYIRDAGSNNGSWSGTDTITETVGTSSLRPAGTYVHANQTDRTTDAAGDRTDIATDSITFTPLGGGSGIQTQTVRNEFQSADHSTDNGTETSTGTLPGGLSFSSTHATEMGPATYSFAVDATLNLADGHIAKAHVAMTGASNPSFHGPASFDPTSAMDLTLLKADGSTEVSLALDKFTMDQAAQGVDTAGVLDDSTGKQLATFSGTFDIQRSSWTGIATFPDGSTRSIDLSAVAQIINDNQ